MPDTRDLIARRVAQIQRMGLQAVEISREYEWVTRQIQWAVWIGQMVKTARLSEDDLQDYLREVVDIRDYLVKTVRKQRRFHPERSKRRFI